jgi:carbon monoxide dehydrogenase subunit G
LEHEFSVPAPPDVVWAAVIDPERVAPCMPGATLTAVDGAEFSGGVKVKLGPVSLMYKGSGEFLETDEQARKVVIKASGKDSRGNGTAAATVTVTLTEDGAGTKGTVVTDLTVTGKPAQFGRGMIVEVSGKLLDTFANCLAGKLGTDSPPAETKPTATQSTNGRAARSDTKPAADEADVVDDGAEEPPPPAKPKPATRRRTPAKAAQKSTPTVSADVPDGAATDKAATDSAPDGAAAEETPPSTDPGADVASTPRLQLVEEEQAAPPPTPKPAPRQVNISSETDAIDLMDYAGPTVAKRAIPAVLGLLVILVVIRLLRRRS